MMNESGGRVSNLDKLRHVPVFAVRDLLKIVLRDAAPLTGRTGEELIELAAERPEITEQAIDDLFEEFRYGGRASFYIYLLFGEPQIDLVPNVLIWNATLTDIQADDEKENLRVEVCDIEALEWGIVEVRYKYQTVYEYIDPETELPASVSELNFGFLGLDLDNRYVVIMSKYDKVNSIMIEAVHTLTGCQPSPVRLSKGFVNTHFHLEDIRRGSWYDGRTRIRRSIAGDDLLAIAGSEVLEQDQESERTAALYNERVRDDLESRLGIHLKRGKIYLTRTIRASDLRQWMYARLHPLILHLQGLSPAEAVRVSGAPLPQLVFSGRGEGFFREIVSGILMKQQNRDELVRLSAGDNEVFASMRRYFLDPEPFFFCEVCEETSPICCPECGGDDVGAYSRYLKCRDCGETLSGPRVEVQCLRGHTSEMDRPEAQLVLRPNYNMQQEVARFINSDTKANFNPDEEFFWIDSTELQYTRNAVQAVFLPDELEEFAALPARNELPDALWEEALDLVHKMKEKCKIDLPEHRGQPRRVDCEQCYEQNLGRLCIPKLFRALDSDFMPLPHGGMEFGDAGLSITIGGTSKMFIGIAKSAYPRKPIADQQITHSDPMANEILQQTVRQALKDQRVEVFGIATPRPLHPEFQGSIRMLSKMGLKPVVFFGHEDLTRMCCALLMDPIHQSLRQ
jgi:hypothetical protein